MIIRKLKSNDRLPFLEISEVVVEYLAFSDILVHKINVASVYTTLESVVYLKELNGWFTPVRKHAANINEHTSV